MSATDQVARMLALVPWLLERPGASVVETAEAFGVDETTIRQDLSHLDFCGLPGLGGGDLFEVTLVEDRILVRMADELRRPLRLTPREALHLVLTVSAVADVLGEEMPALSSALEKVREAVGVPEGVARQVLDEDVRFLEELRQAVADGRRVRLHYRGRKDPEPRWRTVDPWVLHVLEGAWYVQGRDLDAEELRTFRLDRVAELAVLDEEATEPPSSQELPQPRYVPEASDPHVELLLNPEARWLIDAVATDQVIEEDDGRLRLRFRTDAPRHVARLVLSTGGQAEIVEPPSIRNEVRRLATEALHRYGSTD